MLWMDHFRMGADILFFDCVDEPDAQVFWEERRETGYEVDWVRTGEIPYHHINTHYIFTSWV